MMSGQRYYRSQSINAQWDDLSRSISLLLIEHENKMEVSEAAVRCTKTVDITTKHWVDSSIRSHCTAAECAKRFTITERKHHCRRCGEVFCGSCSQYRRRLSLFATPDAEGLPYRVCKKCFDVGPQTLGSLQSHLADFCYYKEKKKCKNNNGSKNDLLPVRSLNYEEECQRLVEGFRKKVGSSKILNFVMDTLSTVKLPEWQKSKHWIETSDQCLLCYKVFSLTDLKSHCRVHTNFEIVRRLLEEKIKHTRLGMKAFKVQSFFLVEDCWVCGKVTCSTCSSETLIVYVEDADREVRWCLINIIGSPDKEPEVCLYLKICSQCHGEVAKIQGKQSMIAEQTETDGIQVSLVDEMASISQLLMDIQGNIQKVLPRYEQLVDAVEAKGDLQGLLPQGGSATQTLAKYHLDLSDHFTKFAIVMQSLKKLKPTTNTQVKLAKNLTSSKFCFYNDNFSVFRENKKRLEQILPLEVLEGVQKIVDDQAINSAYIVIKQLGYEALLLVSSDKVDDNIAAMLVKCEEICKDELQKQLQASDCEFDEHLKTVQQLLQIQLKKHRLVKPSRRLSKAHGSKYVEWLLLDRCHLLLSQIIRQLGGKTATKKFNASKNALETTKLQVMELRDHK